MERMGHPQAHEHLRRWPGRGPMHVGGCDGEDLDSVQHYARCPRLRGWAARALRLTAPLEADRLGDFLLLTPRPRADAAGDLPRRALRTAAAYRVHCLVRHGRVARGPAACEALSQAARDLVRGHSLAGAALDAAELAAWEHRRPGGGAGGAGGGVAAAAGHAVEGLNGVLHAG